MFCCADFFLWGVVFFSFLSVFFSLLVASLFFHSGCGFDYFNFLAVVFLFFFFWLWARFGNKWGV